ncbi:MAG: Holliday junction resolvase RuvX [Actinobacteria bacterium]|nr:Holliday junction resolvase RuvX [Actinomycetota bacterium]
MAVNLRRGRRIGIDFGDVRVGVAITDVDAILSSPLVTLKNDEDLLSSLLDLIKENDPIYLAIGVPLHLSGEGSSKSKLVQDFAKKFKALINIDIFLIDERLTTKSAQNQLRDVGIGSKESKGIIDQLAAVNILNQALLLEASAKGLGDPL